MVLDLEPESAEIHLDIEYYSCSHTGDLTTRHKGNHANIDDCLPPEDYYRYDLHPKAKIEFLINHFGDTVQDCI